MRQYTNANGSIAAHPEGRLRQHPRKRNIWEAPKQNMELLARSCRRAANLWLTRLWSLSVLQFVLRRQRVELRRVANGREWVNPLRVLGLFLGGGRFWFGGMLWDFGLGIRLLSVPNNNMMYVVLSKVWLQFTRKMQKIVRFLWNLNYVEAMFDVCVKIFFSIFIF